MAGVCDVEPAALAERSRARHLSQARELAGLVARDTGAAPLSELAARFGRDLSSYSRAVRRVETNMPTDKSLRERVKAVNNAIMQA